MSLALKALRELGPQKMGLFALYRAGLHSGYFRWKTAGRESTNDESCHPSPMARPLLDLPASEVILEIIGPGGLAQLKAEADEIVDGRVRLFGGRPVPLNLTPPGERSHWTESRPEGDIKFIWEPARFGWAFTLGRAYYLTGDERYPAAFWRYFESFREGNPVNLGPNWESAQEAALRLVAFTFAAQIFARSPSSTSHRQSSLVQSIADHAARIPPTLIYARAQNNNHLLSEAAGLITASLALPAHSQSRHWSKLGWKWFQRGLQTQIAEDGSYTQQSTNYHRLMLQLALWVSSIKGRESGENQIPDAWCLTLGSATRWLLNLCDPESGRVPNLGPNDGAYILPLTVLPFADYRPVLQAASRAFLGEDVFDPGPWDEMRLWLCASVEYQSSGEQQKKAECTSENLSTDPALSSPTAPPSILSVSHSWAYLRAAKFYDRPGHADQLHLELWWRGLNVAQDAGSYLYNADPPWNNALTHTAVHNTVMIDNRQQMTPAGRFLYLDRAEAQVLKRERVEDRSWERIAARHDGYQRLGVIHQRSVTAYQDHRWMIEDQLLPISSSMPPAPHSTRLHWLLPDWDFEILEDVFGVRIKSPYGWVELGVNLSPTAFILPPSSFRLQLVRAGDLLHGSGKISPTWGWISPTYGVKQPALSFSVTAICELPLTFTSEWKFPDE